MSRGKYSRSTAMLPNFQKFADFISTPTILSFKVLRKISNFKKMFNLIAGVIIIIFINLFKVGFSNGIAKS